MKLTIGKKIKLLRISLDLEQKEFAERAGLSPYTIWNWEHDRGIPRQDKLQQIEDAFGVDLDSLRLVSSNHREPADS